MAERSKILIADSQYLVTQSLTQLIESEKRYELCGIADNRNNLVKLLNDQSPDLLITDVYLIDYDSLDDLRSILSDHPGLSLLVLANQINNAEMGRLLKSGIKNISLKTDGKEDLLLSIDMALKHKKHLSEQLLELIIQSGEEKNHASGPSGLTQSELEIVRLIAEGFTTKEIALKKHISFHTVMTHRKNIFRKLEINNVTELIRFAVRQGLTDYLEYNI